MARAWASARRLACHTLCCCFGQATLRSCFAPSIIYAIIHCLKALHSTVNAIQKILCRSLDAIMSYRMARSMQPSLERRAGSEQFSSAKS